MLIPEIYVVRGKTYTFVIGMVSNKISMIGVDRAMARLDSIRAIVFQARTWLEIMDYFTKKEVDSNF